MKGAERKHRNDAKMLTKLTEEEKSKLRTPSEVTQLMTVSMSVVTPKVARAKYVFVLSSAELNQLDLKPILSESV